MLSGLAAMQQASVLDSVSFDSFSFKQDSLASAEVDVSRGEVGDALVISKVIVVSHELANPGFEVAEKIVVFQQDAVLQRLVPSLDLALGGDAVGRHEHRQTEGSETKYFSLSVKRTPARVATAWARPAPS